MTLEELALLVRRDNDPDDCEVCVWPNPAAPRVVRRPVVVRPTPTRVTRAAHYQDARARGLCLRCQKVPARDGRVHCASCARYMAGRQRVYHAGKRAARRVANLDRSGPRADV